MSLWYPNNLDEGYDEYEEQLKEDGIQIAKYDYDRLYRECRDKIKKELLPYKERNEKAIKWSEKYDNKLL